MRTLMIKQPQIRLKPWIPKPYFKPLDENSWTVFNMKEWVSLVWPMRNRDITTCSLLDFLKAGLHSPKVGWIWKSLLWMFMSYRCCHFLWRNLLIVGFKSVYGMEKTLGLRSKADLAAESALIECKALAVIRKQFFKVNSLTDLFENVKMGDVLSFLRETRLYEKIWRIKTG